VNIAVCELPNDFTVFEHGWEQLVSHVCNEGSEMVLLPEMPFGSLNVELGGAEKAKKTYPRFVLD
jgi:hypothetical protein